MHDFWALRITDLQDRMKDASKSLSHSTLFSSDSETDATISRSLTRKGRKATASPKMVDSIALCYLGAVASRISISVGDLHKWLSQGELIYYRAINHLPGSMRDHLPAEYYNSLDPSTILQPGDLHEAILDLAIMFERKHGLTFPVLNYPPLLFRRVWELSLPLEVYSAAKAIAKLLGYEFRFPSCNSGRRLQPVDFPELQLVCALVAATKLIHPFDGILRNPKSAQEPATAVVDWEVWKRGREEDDVGDYRPERLKFEEALKVDDKQAFTMNEDRLDDYLDWYQKLWTKDTVKENAHDSEFRQALYDMFPVHVKDSGERENKNLDKAHVFQAQKRRLCAVVTGLKIPEVVSAEKALDYGHVDRPGSMYKRYRKVEELTGVARSFYEEVAELTGVGLDVLVRAVYQTERKMEAWEQEFKKSRSDT